MATDPSGRDKTLPTEIKLSELESALCFLDLPIGVKLTENQIRGAYTKLYLQNKDDREFHAKLNLAKGVINKNLDILGVAGMEALAEVFIFMCQFGPIFFEVKAKNIIELREAIGEETELGPESYVIRYTSKG